MKPYIFSLFAGILAGIVYYVIGVQSPAPPTVALVGLLGILAGEQILPLARRMLSGNRLGTAWSEAKCSQHMFGPLPGAHASNAAAKRPPSTPT
ncbi:MULTISPECIES: XapX domain-containing protein [Burkholderia]|uniref:XapX domain-containing protein n=1 Tax=Burkholderia cepacia TaxID=292 RepID=UPI00398F1DB4